MKISKANEELDSLLKALRHRVETLDSDKRRASLMRSIRSLTRFDVESEDYPDPANVVFPSTIAISYAVCHPECGIREFIVDGSTQRCDRCGSTMFRTEVAEYDFSQQKFPEDPGS